MVLVIFTKYDTDTGNDLCIRLNALIGMVAFLYAGVILLFFKEIKKGSSV